MSEKARIIVFVNSHFILGGVDTYFYRMIQWLDKRNMKSILLLPRDAEVNESMIEQVQQMGTKVRKELDSFATGDIAPTKINLNLPDGSDVIVITTRYYGFYMAQCLRIYNPECTFTFMDYMTHVNGFKAYATEREDPNRKDISAFQRIYRKGRYRFYKKMTLKTFHGKELYFQNDIHRYSLYDHYGMDHSLTEGPNIPLGIDIPPLDESKILERAKARKDEFQILTITRFEFPFKGYIMGLLDQFAELCERYDNLELIVIGGGNDESKIWDKIHSFSEELQSKIKMVGYVDYDKLQGYFEKASLYVGLSTTVLDAGKQGLLSVPVAFFTEKCMSYSYLYEYVEIYAPEQKERSIKWIEEVINMSDEEYERLSKLTYENVDKELNLENVMPKILSVKNAKNRYEMNKVQLWIIKKLYQKILSRNM